MKRNKTVLCVFAHPDDESFGPGGTLAVLSQTHDVYLLCVTDGAAANHNKNLSDIRKKELIKASGILGIKELFFLGYADGSLNNLIYHQLVQDIEVYIRRLNPDMLLTFELRGVSGHLDHVAIAMVTSYVFEKYQAIKQLWYFCESTQSRKFIQEYFIYFPPGYQKKDIDMIVDVTSVWKKKIAAIKAHVSQKDDGQWIIRMLRTLPKQEHFLVWKRK